VQFIFQAFFLLKQLAGGEVKSLTIKSNNVGFSLPYICWGWVKNKFQEKMKSIFPR